MHTLDDMSYIFCFFLLIVFICICLSNIRLLSFVEIEAVRQRALVRAAVASKKKKEKEGASLSTPKDVIKGTSKRKSVGKDDCPLKKGLGIPAGDKKPKQSLLSKAIHGVGKGLMMETGLATQGVRRLLMHKEHAVEMVESIIKETDLDPCAEQLTEDLRVLGLFDLARVCFSSHFVLFLVCFSC